MPATRRPLGPPISELLTRAGLIIELAAMADISEYRAGLVLRELEDLIARSLMPGGAGIFVLPGVARFSADTITHPMSATYYDTWRKQTVPRKNAMSKSSLRIKVKAATKLRNALLRERDKFVSVDGETERDVQADECRRTL